MSGPKSLHPAKASRDTFMMLAVTDKICSQSVANNFATELLRVDPLAELEDGCLVVVIDRRMAGPRMTTWESRPATDDNGRFKKGPKGFALFNGIRYDHEDRDIYIVGRVIGPARDLTRARSE